MSDAGQRLGGDGSGLVGHWMLCEDCSDGSGAGNNGENRGADLAAEGHDGTSNSAAGFDGREAVIEVADSTSLQPGPGDFSISAWVHTDDALDDVLGDIVGKYDPASRTGFNFGIQNFSGVTSAQSNYRHLHFGIDAGRIDSEWTDCGRPGNNLCVFALAVHEGELYAGTFEIGKDEAGHVYRYAGSTEWVDCGSPDPCNSVSSLAVYDRKLYAGVSHYRSVGSSLQESPNLNPGGRIYRYEGGTEWKGCGKPDGPTASTAVYDTGYMAHFVGWSPDNVDGIHGMAVYRNELYAIPMFHQGVFRYEGGTEWTDCGGPGCRMMSLAVFDGHLYGAGNEGNKRGGIYRYDGGTTWTRTGDQDGVDQVYSFAVYEGKLHAGTWPDARVFRYDGEDMWSDCGKMGDQLEAMAMAVYNGKMYGGTLPLAEVYRYDGGTTWTRTGQLDTTPDVRYRRAWSMAVFQGKLFCGTLPSGHVYSLEAGKNVTYDCELQPGWRHLAAIREGERLRLYVDGKPVASSSAFNPGDYDISNDRPLRIGAGAHDSFNGRIRDLRIYNRALGGSEVSELCKRA